MTKVHHSPTLRDDMIKRIDALLAAEPGGTTAPKPE